MVVGGGVRDIDLSTLFLDLGSRMLRSNGVYLHYTKQFFFNMMVRYADVTLIHFVKLRSADAHQIFKGKTMGTICLKYL